MPENNRDLMKLGCPGHNYNSDIIGILLSHSLAVLFILVDGLGLIFVKSLIGLLNLKTLDGNCLVILLALEIVIVQSKWDQ